MKPLPFRHLSLRIPWQDSRWNGTVCKSPLSNSACLCLKGIAETRDDAWELQNAGAHIDSLNGEIPPCVRERATFMSERKLEFKIGHKLSHDQDYKHLQETPFELPAHSAPGVPFNWLSREGATDRKEKFAFGYDENKEPMDRWKASGSWVLDPENQKECLDAFWSAIQPGRSLVFFYAKAIPGVEDNRRILLGAARVTELKPLRPYIPGDPAGEGAWIWERPVVHSLRAGFHDGFLMPYHELIAAIEAGKPLNLPDFVAFAPEDRRSEFSYATEHVSADAALGALEEMRRCLLKCADEVAGPWASAQSWINDRLIEVRKQRGAYPGLGAALTALGLPLGEMVAASLTESLGMNDDPWRKVDECFADPKVLDATLRSQITASRQSKWKRMSKGRKDFIKFLSRLALTAEQAGMLWHEEDRPATGIVATEPEMLNNPYLISEQWIRPAIKVAPRETEEEEEEITAIVNPPSFWTVDRAVFLPAALSLSHPLPGEPGTWECDDRRRVRAMICHVLQVAESEGHTALPSGLLLERLKALALEPAPDIDADLLDTLRQEWEIEEEEKDLEPWIVFHPVTEGLHLVQTRRRDEMTRLIRSLPQRVRKLPRIGIEADWRGLLNKNLPPDPGTLREGRARQEKAAALNELASARFSVLVGPAGTGKTSILRTLVAEPSINNGGVLLLAPTGKARVRLQTQTRHPAQTLGQFLVRLGRYQPATGTYFPNPDRTGSPSFKTVIVDEASMLTEDQLAALYDALKGADRIILVGDPGQLPPIGSGRPFVDLVESLKPAEACWPKLGKGYAELTQRMRQDHDDESQPLDLQLAEFFSGRIADAEILHHLRVNRLSGRIRCERWETTDEFRTLFREVLADEFGLPANDLSGLCASLGALLGNGGRYFFNRGSESEIENWQVLAPMNLSAGGTAELNRVLHFEMRGSMVAYANSKQSAKFRVPKPLGAQQIVYGSKVINTENGPHKYVSPGRLEDGTRPMRYLSNGEIGVFTGEKLGEGDPASPWFPKKIQVCFSSQPGFAYTFLADGFGDDGEPPLQLAYAITVHKSQGSEFKKTFVVLPKYTATLSRELLYTALTRHKEKVILLHQGDLTDLGHWASSAASATARRFTTVNVGEPDEDRRPVPTTAKCSSTGREGWYEQYLIHRTRRGTLVSSRAEVAIANELDYARSKRWLDYQYEERLYAGDGSSRLPDFTVRDELGRTFYWEHCGLPDDAGYSSRWREKLAWYENLGFSQWNPETNPDGRLIVTTDVDGRLDTEVVRKIIIELFKV